MPTPIIANATKVTVVGTLFGQLVENVWYVQTADPPATADLLAIASDFQVGYAAIMAPLSGDFTVSEIDLAYIGSAAGPEVSFGVTPPQAGGATTGSEPGNVCLCVSLRTALPGRRFRGRKYFSGIPIGKVVANQVDATLAADIVTAVNDLIGTLDRNGTPLSIVSFVGLTIVPVVTALAVDLFSDSQRRRLTKRGR